MTPLLVQYFSRIARASTVVVVALLAFSTTSGASAQYLVADGFPTAQPGVSPLPSATLAIPVIQEDTEGGMGRLGGTILGSVLGAGTSILLANAVGEDSDFLEDNSFGSLAVWVIAGTTLGSALGAHIADDEDNSFGSLLLRSAIVGAIGAGVGVGSDGRDGGLYLVLATPIIQALVVGIPLIGD